MRIMDIKPYYFFATDFTKKLDAQRETIYKAKTAHADKIANKKDPTNKVSLSERIDDFLRIETLVRSRLNRQIVDGIRKVNYMGDPFNDTYRTIDGQIVGLSGILSYGNEIISELRKII